MANENPKVNLALVQNLPESGSLVTGTLYMSPEEEGNFVKVAVSDASTVTIFDGSKYVTKEEIDEFEYTAATALNDVSARIDDLSARMDDIDVDLLVKVTYDELKELRDSSSLVPGMKYRMTDYDTRIFKPGADSMHHRFDLILLALSEDTLSEDCRAIQHEFTDDELNEYSEEEVHYFDGCELDAWRIMYTIDNDTDRFDWVADGSIEYILAPADLFVNEDSIIQYERLSEYDLPDGSSGNTDNVGNFRYMYKKPDSNYNNIFLDTSTLYDSSYSLNIGYRANGTSTLYECTHGDILYSTEIIIDNNDSTFSDYVSGEIRFEDDWNFYTILPYIQVNEYNMRWLSRYPAADNLFASQGYDTSSGWFAYTLRNTNKNILTLWYNDAEEYSLAQYKARYRTYYYKEYLAKKHVFPKYGYISSVSYNAKTDEVISTNKYEIIPAETGGVIAMCADLSLGNGSIESVSISIKVLPYGIDENINRRYYWDSTFDFDKLYTQFFASSVTVEPYLGYTDASVFRYTQEERQNGYSKGIIYGMVDEYGNDMPYDFKNIVYQTPNGFLPTFSGDSGPDRSSKRGSLTKSGGSMSLSTGHTGNMVYTFSRIDSSLNIYDATLKPINITPFNPMIPARLSKVARMT